MPAAGGGVGSSLLMSLHRLGVNPENKSIDNADKDGSILSKRQVGLKRQGNLSI